MTYETAKEVAKKANEVAYSVIEDAVRDIPDEDFLKIPIIDAYTRVAAQKYGWSFPVYRKGDFTKYYNMYILTSYLFREEKEIESK